MLSRVIFLVFILNSLATALPLSRNAAIRQGGFPPNNWILKGNADSSEKITVTVALKQVNREWLDTTLRLVSYPDSPQYGRHKTLEEIATQVHAHPDSVSTVKEIFHSVGVSPSFTIGETFAVAEVPVHIAERLFSARFYNFEHTTGLKTTRTLEYSIPAKLSSHVDFICCMDQFPNPDSKSLLKSYGRLSSIDNVSPQSIEESYNISGYSSSSPNNSQAVAGFLKQYFRPSDLTKFQEKFNVPSNPIAKVLGTNEIERPGGEASLDVQYITAVGRNVPTWFISVSTYANNKQEDFLSWLLLLANTTNSPWVHSGSYGDIESTIDSNYMQRCEDEFKKLGISGRTILFAAGDSGVACRHSKFTPNWPTSSPSITSVGGTVTLTEVWPSGGGGFSDEFPTPDYQMDAVQAYLNDPACPSTKKFNPKGRAYPDVSAFAMGFLIYVEGREEDVGGTSCAAPTTAGVVSLLNDVRLNAGKSTLGFLNPLLYKLQGKGFIDVTSGSNNNYNPSCGGFKTIKGWDPASGWGGPNFGLLKDLVLQQ